MMHINSDPKVKIQEDLIRHIVLNSLRSYNKQFKSKYGSMVICCDSKKYWRREVFPFYKSNRRKAREKSEFDWGLIFETLNKIRDELKKNFPYRVLEVEGAEADDIIAVLAGRFSSSEDVLILSSDKDFVQLQKYDNVQQYSPILKRFIRTDDPYLFVKEHILKGDAGDGIPNFLSADNTFAIGERQKRINKTKLLEWLKTDPNQFCVTDTMKRGYNRNKMLVDLDCVPDELKSKIVESYDTTKPNTKMNMLNYLIQNKLKNLVEVADEF
jgi:5'-3' exonuclease